jgi:hypothetical protein
MDDNPSAEEANTQKIHENSLSSYIPRGQNVLQKIFKTNFEDFSELYDKSMLKIIVISIWKGLQK